MIDKKGHKSNRTVLMENAVYRYFKNEYGITLIPEVKVSTGRVDFLGYVKENQEDLITIHDVIAVEIKQAASDFHSGCGLNFVGVSNYVAVPSELVGYAVEFLRETGRWYVGVVEVTNDGFVRTVIYPHCHNGNDYIKLSPFFLIANPYHLLRVETK